MRFVITMGQNNVNRAVPDTALKIVAITESEDEDSAVLASLLKDLIHNRGTPVKRWSDATKSLFAIILDYGGLALARIVQEKIGGPSLQTMYRTARSNYTIPCKLEKQALRHTRSFYDTIGYNGVFALAVDATAVIPTMRVTGNKIIGLATECDVIVNSAQDILNVVKNREYELAKQANAFILAPLQEHVPFFVLAVAAVFKGQDYTLTRLWCNHAVLWGARNKITIVGLRADGDPKFRKYYVERFKKTLEERNDIISLNHDSFDFNIVVENFHGLGVNNPVLTVMFPDWRHLVKKWRNQLLNVKRILIIDSDGAQIEHLMKVFENDRIWSGLGKSNVFVKDKQNVDAAMRIMKTEVRVCIKDWSDSETIGTRTYLKMGHSILQSFTEKDLTVRERAKLAWAPVTFLRYWRVWLQISNYDVEKHLISQQTFEDTILARHGLILAMKMFSMYYPNHEFHPWVFGSQRISLQNCAAFAEESQTSHYWT